MFFEIKNVRAYMLAKKIAVLTGRTVTEVVIEALQEKLTRVERVKSRVGLAEELNRIALRCASLPRRDNRSPEKIIDYDEFGLSRRTIDVNDANN